MIRHLSHLVAGLALALAAGLAAAQPTVDANQASQAELETVKGIGPGLSGKIVEARKAGAFKDWADFVGRVGGVGEGNATKFSQAGLRVGGAAYGSAGAGQKPAAAAAAAKDSKDGKAPKAAKGDAPK